MSRMFLTALRLSLHGGLIALAVILLRLMLKKAPKAIHVALWGLVALRLLLPFTVEFRFSAVPEVIGSGQVLEEWAEEPLGKYDIFYEGNPEYLQARMDGIHAQLDEAGKRYVMVFEDPETADKTVKDDLLPVLLWIWLAGAGGMLVYMAFSYSRLHKLTLGAFRERENIYRSERIASPFLLGVVRPRICLPLGLEEPELTYVLAHEQAHIARKDHWWKAIGFWILCIHWFNPVLWAAYVLFCKDIEFACDAYVAKTLSHGELADYSQALLNCSLHERRNLPCPLSFAETGVRARVKKILNYRKPGIRICLAAAVAACLCALFLMTGSGPETPVTELPTTDLPGVTEVPESPEEPVWLKDISYPDTLSAFAASQSTGTTQTGCSWQRRTDGKTVRFTLVHDSSSTTSSGFGHTLSINGSDGSQYPAIETDARLENTNLLACDGRYAYFCEPWNGSYGEQIVRLDLKTHLWETLLEAEDQVWPVQVSKGAVLYYLLCEGATVRVCRMYLPKKEVTVFGSLTAPPDALSIWIPDDILEAPEYQLEILTPPPTEATTPQIQQPEDPLRPWLTEPQHPSYLNYRWYDDYFDLKADPLSWQDAEGTVTYRLIHDGAPENPGSSLSVRSGDGTVYEAVFVSGALTGGKLLCCDGRYAWFCEDWDGYISYRRISRVDLKTGERRIVTEKEKIWDIYVMEGMVIYYMTYNGEEVRVCRMYLPEAEENGRYAMFLPERLDTGNGSVPVIPEMVELTPPATRNGNPSWKLTAERAR